MLDNFAVIVIAPVQVFTWSSLNTPPFLSRNAQPGALTLRVAGIHRAKTCPNRSLSLCNSRLCL